MGFFDTLKKAFSAGGDRDVGMYFYVKLDKSGEIVKIRLDPRQDLAPEYGKGTYRSRKTITGPESLQKAEATFLFDENRSFQNADITGGSLVSEEEYNQQKQA
jgi:hypothetical protein